MPLNLIESLTTGAEPTLVVAVCRFCCWIQVTVTSFSLTSFWCRQSSAVQCSGHFQPIFYFLGSPQPSAVECNYQF